MRKLAFRKKFFFKSAHAEGALDARTKELIHIAVVTALHCEP